MNSGVGIRVQGLAFVDSGPSVKTLSSGVGIKVQGLAFVDSGSGV